MTKGTEERSGRKLWDADAWKAARFFLNYLRPHKVVFIPAMIALACTGAMSALFFYLLGDLASHILSAQPDGNLMEYATHSVKLCMAVVAVQAVVAFFRIWLFAKASERALSSLRLDTFSRIIRLPMTTLNRARHRAEDELQARALHAGVHSRGDRADRHLRLAHSQAVACHTG